MFTHKHNMMHCFCTKMQSVWFIRVISLSIWHTPVPKLWGDIQRGEEKQKPQRQQYILSQGDGKAGPQFVFLFALDCNVAFPSRQQPASSISSPRVCLSLCCDERDVSCFLNWETSAYLMRLIQIFTPSATKYSSHTATNMPSIGWRIRQAHMHCTCTNVPVLGLKLSCYTSLDPQCHWWIHV